MTNTVSAGAGAEEAGRRDALAAIRALLGDGGVLIDQAGLASLRVLPVDHLFWRFYELSG